MLLETVGDAASATPQPRLPQHPFPAMQHCPLTARLLPKYNIYGGSQANLTSNPEVIPSVALASLGGGCVCVHPILYGSRALQGSSHPHPSSSPQAEGGMGGFDSRSTAAHHQYGGDEIEGRGQPPTPGMLQHPASMLN